MLLVITAASCSAASTAGVVSTFAGRAAEPAAAAPAAPPQELADHGEVGDCDAEACLYTAPDCACERSACSVRGHCCVV